MSFNIDLVDQHRRSLRQKLEQDRINSTDLLEGIAQCFAVTQREFVASRRPELTTEEVFKISHELVNDVYQEEGISADNLVLSALIRAVEKLNTRFDFSQDKALLERHEFVIDAMIQKMDQTNPQA